jgi:aspartoacylase
MLELPSRGKNLAPRNIRKVFIMGGTHGNERTGIHAVQYIQENLNDFYSGSVRKIETIYGNPRAIARNSRYIEMDLNRAFTYDYRSPISEEKFSGLASSECTYEALRALEIRRNMGALSHPADFVIDLHTTTSEMGNCLIVSDDDPWTDALCSRLQGTIPHCNVLYDPVSREVDPTSSSLALNHLTLEMGPFHQGEASLKAVKSALNTIKDIIATVGELNGKDLTKGEGSYPLKKFVKLPYQVDYPRGEGGFPQALIHPEFTGSDFLPLTKGQSVFQRNDGTNINLMEGELFPEALFDSLNENEEIVPFFIGEAAYIEKGIAFLIAKPYLLSGNP